MLVVKSGEYVTSTLILLLSRYLMAFNQECIKLSPILHKNCKLLSMQIKSWLNEHKWYSFLSTKMQNSRNFLKLKALYWESLRLQVGIELK